VIELTDLTKICRESGKLLTTVSLCLGEYWDRSKDMKWLLLGETQLRKFERPGNPPYWWLAAYLGEGATDYEHDSAYALRLPLIALEFQRVEYHCAEFYAVVHPNQPSDFYVPWPGYNPLKGAEVCTECKGDDAHKIVSEYVPAHDAGLYKQVAGKLVLISIGPAR